MASSANVVALMAEDRDVVLCADAGDLAAKLKAKDVQWAVVVDLERRMISNIEAGESTEETVVDGEDAESILLGISEALKAMVDTD